MVNHSLGHEAPETHEVVASLTLVNHIVHGRLGDLGITKAGRVRPIHCLATLIEKVVVRVPGVSRPLLSVVAAVIIAAHVRDLEARYERVRETSGQLFADQVRRGLLLEPHWYSVTTAGRAHHVAMVIKQNIDAVVIAEVEDRVKPLEELGIKRILVARLCPGPSNAEANGVPPHLFDVVNVSLVERGARLARIGRTALVVHRHVVVTIRRSRHLRQVGVSFDDNIRAGHHGNLIGRRIDEILALNVNTARSWGGSRSRGASGP
mmetsp:Transcript_57765/g.159375  ORF Transcript_57765/g.159375 Transcript_57765/m.159375 type:complete len:264 (-) Transcript_57765:185-976(-)